ncbi:MAG: beta family protein [Janthinobacterium lividum]
MLYYPLLRTKKGEVNALTTLSPDAVAATRPILQVAPPDRNEKGELVAASSEYVTKIANTLHEVLAFGSQLSCYLDPSPAHLSTALLEDLLFAIGTYGGTPQPVYSLFNSIPYARLYRQLMGAPKAPIIRVRPDEITITVLDDIEKALQMYQLEAHQTLILLDVGNIIETNGYFEVGLKGTINDFKTLGLAGIILASCALPESLEEVTKWKPATYSRKEAELFKKMKAATRCELQFGDYATGSVKIEPNIGRIGAPKVRYTLPDHYEILKGQMVGSRPHTMSEQYHRISEYLVSLPGYPGKHFSWGDDYIYKSSLGGLHSRGNGTTWVSVSTSHHIELVVSTLPAM